MSNTLNAFGKSMLMKMQKMGEAVQAGGAAVGAASVDAQASGGATPGPKSGEEAPARGPSSDGTATVSLA